MNIRHFLSTSQPYYLINREERYFAALLYAALLQRGENLAQFLAMLNRHLPAENRLPEVDPDTCELYFEYTYLRDLWNTIGSDNDLKRNIILQCLRLSSSSDLQYANPLQFNSFFGAGKVAASRDHIMSPATWALTKYSRNIPDDTEFLQTCKFKWSFNAKPDLVIQLETEHVVCIEAKFESGEGSYPSSFADNRIFAERKISHVSQIALQQYMFSDLLGMTLTHFFLTKRADTRRHNAIFWEEVFATLALDSSHPFLKKALQARRIIDEVDSTPHGT